MECLKDIADLGDSDTSEDFDPDDESVPGGGGSLNALKQK
jgi:hypothetical protein